jgi:hypothetical protein
MVHYVSQGSRNGIVPTVCRAAVVTEVTEHPEADMTAGLFVMEPAGGRPVRDVPCDLGAAEDDPRQFVAQLCDGLWHAPGTWHWPARV